MNRQLIRMNDGRLNLANLFTISRLPLCLIGLAFYVSDYKLFGVIVIALAAWSDFFDGLVAKKLNCKTDFGGKFDPIVDKVFMTILILFVLVNVEIGRNLVLFVLSIEILNAFVTLLTKWVKKREIKVTEFGRKGMFARMSAITWILLASCGSGGFFEFMEKAAWAAAIVGVALGIVAFVQYIGQALKP